MGRERGRERGVWQAVENMDEEEEVERGQASAMETSVAEMGMDMGMNVGMDVGMRQGGLRGGLRGGLQGVQLVSASRDRTIKIWALRDSKRGNKGGDGGGNKRGNGGGDNTRDGGMKGKGGTGGEGGGVNAGERESMYECVRTLRGHTRGVFCLTTIEGTFFNGSSTIEGTHCEDGDGGGKGGGGGGCVGTWRVASGSGDRTIVVWNTATWKVNWFILYVIMVNIVVTRRDERREHNPLCSVRRVCVCACGVPSLLITHYPFFIHFYPFTPLTL